MLEVIHHDDSSETVVEKSETEVSFLIVAVLSLVALFSIFYYGLPAMRSMGGGTQVNVPRQIDVNVNQPAAPVQ